MATNHLLVIKVLWLRKWCTCTFTEKDNEDVTIIQVNVSHRISDPLQITQFTPVSVYYICLITNTPSCILRSSKYEFETYSFSPQVRLKLYFGLLEVHSTSPSQATSKVYYQI